ncbi:NADPH-dependent FMN reductase [Pelagibacterium lacus]|uniref:NAD(P)H-dependent oxidoreductase n=1 Tax=Pelagibacterium lacus TaxID=2282655 RepID=A0A369W6B6_9HYPH|nr:NADPH-dependent FMN reductase [Pelagibacterium lacus]RDE10216.1 NAD(P)H-dependent oxidoreductase [Pelagibacterium lacus]
MSKPKIGIIISSTRAARFADKPAQWILEKAQQRGDADYELVDLRDFDLPFFDEVASNAWVPSQDPKAVAWQKKIAEFDGYIFIVAEYNRSITGALKNALDQAYVEWTKKPAAYVGYGSVGAARAIEQLRLINVELQMVPVRQGVHISGSEFFTVWGGGKNEPMSAIEGPVGPSVNDMFDNLVWWTNATKTAREDDVRQAAE